MFAATASVCADPASQPAIDGTADSASGSGLGVKFWLAIYGVMSVLTFFVYGWDKLKAGMHGWRVRNATLHFMELLGGWPGAILAIIILRHKIHRVTFLAVTGAIIALHVFIWWKVW